MDESSDFRAVHGNRCCFFSAIIDPKVLIDCMKNLGVI